MVTIELSAQIEHPSTFNTPVGKLVDDAEVHMVSPSASCCATRLEMSTYKTSTV